MWVSCQPSKCILGWQNVRLKKYAFENKFGLTTRKIHTIERNLFKVPCIRHVGWVWKLVGTNRGSTGSNSKRQIIY